MFRVGVKGIYYSYHVRQESSGINLRLVRSPRKTGRKSKKVTHLTLRLARLEEEIEDLRRENTELRIPLLCDACRTYLQSKLPGDTIEVCPCAKCIGIR